MPKRTQTPLLPKALALALRRHVPHTGRFILSVTVSTQTMWLFEKARATGPGAPAPEYRPRQRYLVSTSAFGIGQTINSNRTPLGLHRIAKKIGAGLPTGTVFRSRQPIGLTWKGLPAATIAHRILWLEGLEPGRNRGGEVDTFRRYIYIHGTPEMNRLGSPASYGCIRMGCRDVVDLYNRVGQGADVYVVRGSLPSSSAPRTNNLVAR